ncbi:TPA: glycyl-radical enzyme activating protein [Candidatus Poribacteria bacterium]|nr:glycyl-radical enzyme activating protein [Candidatus Poribacteria bacterium]
MGMIFDIKRFAVHDGPGIRTTLFLKGCPLRCIWCHNPEGISRRPQLVFTPQRCIGCGRCLDLCPQGAHRFDGGRHLIEWEDCLGCGSCAEGCYSEALRIAGREVSVEEVMREVLSDRPFYETSGGGMTLSGGEPLAQPQFSLALLQAAKSEGIHTALDTSGFAPWETFEELLPFTDLILYDLKHMDERRHVELTGVSNGRILENLRRLDNAGKRIWVRIPLVPGYNDEDSNYHALGRFLSGLENVEQIHILRYHKLAESKYENIGRSYPLKGMEPPAVGWAESRKRILLNYGLSHTIIE